MEERGREGRKEGGGGGRKVREKLFLREKLFSFTCKKKKNLMSSFTELGSVIVPESPSVLSVSSRRSQPKFSRRRDRVPLFTLDDTKIFLRGLPQRVANILAAGYKLLLPAAAGGMAKTARRRSCSGPRPPRSRKSEPSCPLWRSAARGPPRPAACAAAAGRRRASWTTPRASCPCSVSRCLSGRAS